MYSEAICPEATMNRFVHSLALAAVFVHTLCGCCWHHAHADDIHDHHALAGRADVSCHQRHDLCGCEDFEHGSSPGEQPCRGVTCDFVRAESGGLQPWLVQFETSVPAAVLPAVGPAHRSAEVTAFAIEPRGRLHLLLQRLLV